MKYALKDYVELRDDFVQYVAENKTQIAMSGEPAGIREWIRLQRELRDPIGAAMKALSKAEKFEQTKEMRAPIC